MCNEPTTESLYSIGLHKSPDASVDSVYQLFSGGEIYELGGHGKPKPHCGEWKATEVCMDTEAHAGFHFDHYGNCRDYTGLIYIRKIKMGCFSMTCPKCYRNKWAKRDAFKIDHRLSEIVKALPKGNRRTAQVEHVIVSFPRSMWGLPFKVLVKKALKSLYALGVSGCMIFHAGRYWNEIEARERGVSRGWHLGLHFHVLGIIQGGYGCRGCKKSCKDGHCNGFKSRCYFQGIKDGLFVKVAVNKRGVAEKRKSVYASALYELRHAWFRKGMKRAGAVHWFGICSYRKAKVAKPVPKRHECPLCHKPLVQGHRYVGHVDSASGCFFAPLIEDGVETIVPDVKSWVWESRSGSYEKDY